MLYAFDPFGEGRGGGNEVAQNLEEVNLNDLSTSRGAHSSYLPEC